MFRCFIRLGLAAIFSIAAFLPAVRTNAQLANNWVGVGTANWNVPGNWSANALPDGPVFDEFAGINGNGSVFVDSAIATNPGEIRLGQLSGSNNVLEIRNNGNLRAERVLALVTNGGVHIGGFVGSGNNGTLRVLAGGTLTVDGVLDTSGDAGNVVSIGGLSGSTATVNAGAATLLGKTTFFANGDLNVLGNAPGFEPDLVGDLAFGPSGSYTFVINPAQNSTVTAVGNAALAGPLVLDFNGFTPTAGQSWNLVEGADVTGAFSSISTPDTLAAGQKLTMQTVPITGGKRLQATVSRVLVANVNRDTGAIRLSNPNTPGISFDGYSVKSASGKLTPVGWNSLDDQNALGGDWRESNASINQLAELKPTTSGSIGANGSQALGSGFNALGGTFGSRADLTFDYTLPDGSVVDGIVNYSGVTVNTLLLQVDPVTGEARMRNTSQTTAQIDGYDIKSQSSALSVGGWNSLDDQNAAGGDWRESNASSSQLSELKPSTSTTLSPGAAFNLGSPFVTVGSRDLNFNFLQFGQQAATTGEVIYAMFADYNLDGVVDTADYVTWRDTLGSMTDLRANGDNAGASAGKIDQADYNYWRAHFGMTFVAASSSASGTVVGGAVPEPASWLILTLGAACCVAAQRKRVIPLNPKSPHL